MLCHHLRLGAYMELAAIMAGITVSTLYRWIKLGAAGAAPYRDFSEAVAQARAEAECRDVALLRVAASTHWGAAAWLLERRHLERWGRRPKVARTGAITAYVVTPA